MPLHRRLAKLACLLVCLLVCLVVCLVAGPAEARVDVSQANSGYLGRQLYLGPASGKDLQTLSQAQASGQLQRSQQAVPRFGIGAPAQWLYLPLHNPQPLPVQRTLQIGEAWIDELDLYLLDPQGVVQHVQAGDGQLDRQQASPGMGFLLDVQIPPGDSALYLRVATADALILPMRLLDSQQVALAQQLSQYSYGALYGFLLALIAYNLMLYAGLRETSNLYYSLYLATFILLNLSYTGHAGAWLWPDSLYLKRYSTLLLMMALAWTGLRFARHFLDLASHAPRLDQALRHGSRLAVLLLILCVLADWHALANHLAFASVLLYTLLMVAAGWLSLHHGRVAARYFLAATLCGMLGTALTDLAVWGVIPFNPLTYRAVDLGILLEASLLALALAYQMRQHQQARRQAESLARQDPLTGLLNRRAFLEQGQQLWQDSQRSARPLALIMLETYLRTAIELTAIGQASQHIGAGLVLQTAIESPQATNPEQVAEQHQGKYQRHLRGQPIIGGRLDTDGHMAIDDGIDLGRRQAGNRQVEQITQQRLAVQHANTEEVIETVHLAGNLQVEPAFLLDGIGGHGQ